MTNAIELNPVPSSENAEQARHAQEISIARMKLQAYLCGHWSKGNVEKEVLWSDTYRRAFRILFPSYPDAQGKWLDVVDTVKNLEQIPEGNQIGRDTLLAEVQVKLDQHLVDHPEDRVDTDTHGMPIATA